MEREIVNRVAKSPLITIDLEDYYPEGKRMALDIAPWLWEGMVLKEKDFRDTIAALDTEPYKNTFIHIHCTADAIIPAWAYTLVAIKLIDVAQKVVVGTREDLETILYTEVIEKLDIKPYANKPLIIKGCSNKPVPENAYLLLAQKLKPIAKSIMYGEACSAVPLYKARKNK